MSKNYFNRLEYLDYLIRSRATGTPRMMAKKMDVSLRTGYQYINILKSLGASIHFDKHKQSYYYGENGRFNFRFVPDEAIPERLS